MSENPLRGIGNLVGRGLVTGAKVGYGIANAVVRPRTGMPNSDREIEVRHRVPIPITDGLLHGLRRILSMLVPGRGSQQIEEQIVTELSPQEDEEDQIDLGPVGEGDDPDEGHRKCSPASLDECILA